ncbi:hypothetical protein [Salinibaculum rarum]|uniref:hypothetical protein n=1 Tax=Salinibaculum rarum TaxID=3058903 RepID=UPI00265DAA8B|nr:hypothetical protein [Salinibaculum sp. KK48]
MSIELKMNPDGIVLDIYAHTEEKWWNLYSYARSWDELNTVQPPAISKAETIWSESYDMTPLDE